jgi:hypothetical protein
VPRVSNAFVGREAELAELGGLFVDADGYWFEPRYRGAAAGRVGCERAPTMRAMLRTLALARVRAPGAVVSYAELTAAIWPGE